MARIVVLTGAGVSAESGLGTFRDEGGIWSQYDLSEVATPEGFEKNPKLVQDFYNARRRNLLEAEPNAAHMALAEYERARPGELLIVTQNIDDLHERAGSRAVIHMHGELLKSLCGACGERREQREDLSPASICGACGAAAMRPDVVWFGEVPYHMERIAEALEAAEMFASIGTSGQVYPAAGFVYAARSMGLRTLELNLEATSSAFDEAILGPATAVVPDWVNALKMSPAR